MNRQQRRRAYRSMGILKNKSSRPYADPTRLAISKQLSEEGKAKHKALIEENERKNSEKLEHKYAEYKKQLWEDGWRGEEITFLLEAWSIRSVKDKENYQQDKKKYKNLTKKAERKRTKRLKK